MIQLYQKLNILAVLTHFFKNPEEKFYLRELGRILDMSPMTVKRALELLKKENLIIKEEQKNQILYHANTESTVFRYAKISYNLSVLEEYGIKDRILNSIPGVSSIVLYGSHAKGENDKYSDLDILVISTLKKLNIDISGMKIDVELNILNFTREKWSRHAKSNRAFYLDVITEGVVLYGTRPVV
jgi:predicted nucleotidyltransferase